MKASCFLFFFGAGYKIIIMLVAFITTKSVIYSEKGFWKFLHGSRTDWAMLFGSIFLLIKGGCFWSVDNKIMPIGK